MVNINMITHSALNVENALFLNRNIILHNM